MANEVRLIDVDKAKKDFNLHFGDVPHAVISNKILDDQPTVDAVEVVRCKDCRYLEITGCYGECAKLVRIVKPWDFCSLGERKTDG
jgi:hypothetical protein